MSPRAQFRRECAATAHLAWPLVAAQLGAFGQGVIEVVLAGHYDQRVLGAVAIGANVASVPLMAMIGTMYAVPASVAQLDGAGQRGRTAPLFVQAAWLGLLIGLLMLAVVRWAVPPLVLNAGVPAELAEDVGTFLRAVSFAMPAIGLFVACRGFSDGLSMPKPGMVLSLAGLVLLGPLGYALLFGALGLPSFGAAGTATAAVIVDWIQALAFLAYVRFGRRYRDAGWGDVRRWLPHPATMRGLLRVGLPMGVTVVMEVGMFSVAAVAIGRFGAAAAGAHQVALNVAALAFMVPLGLGNAITVRVGNAAGRGDAAGERRAGFAGFALVLGAQGISSALMLLFPAAIASLYTSDAAVVAGATLLLRIAGIFQFSDGLQVAANGALRGLKDTRVPMLLTALAYWAVGTPLGLWLALGLGWQAPGMWIGMTAGLTVAAALLLGRFVRRTAAGRARPVLVALSPSR